jgi:protein SCO1/2
MTRNIKVVRQRLAEQGRDDYLFVSVSIEPDQDTPAQMARYMAVNGIENKPGVSPWIFLTGRIEDIDAVRRSLGVYELDPVLDADRTQHGGILTFGNDKSDWWGAAAALSNPESIQRTMLRLTGDDHRGLPRLAAASPPEA